MKSILFTVLFALVSSIAFAQTAEVPTEAQINAKKAECDAKFAGASTSMTLARSQCHLAISITVLEFKSRADSAGAEEVKKELAHQRMLLDSITKSLKALETAAKQTPKPEPAAAPQPQQQPQAGMMPPPFIGGAPFQVMEPLFQLQAFTKEIPEITSRIRIFSLARGVTKWIGWNANQARVIILKNGDPLDVINPNRPGVFTEFYADRDGDGQPDAMPYKGIDPSLLDTVYVPTEKGDVIQLVFLSPLGQRKVMVQGLPPQTLWGHPVRVKIDRIRGMGTFHTPAYEGIRVN
jgi:hypothetical protein